MTGTPEARAGLLTIGYQGAVLDALLRSLIEAGVAHVVDVRAVPLSRKPGFSKRQLAAGLETAGIGYTGLRALGTPRAGRDAARHGDVAAMRAIFARQLATVEAQRDLELLRGMVDEAAVCLICFERDPAVCHRQAVVEALDRPVRHLFCAAADVGASIRPSRSTSKVSSAGRLR